MRTLILGSILTISLLGTGPVLAHDEARDDRGVSREEVERKRQEVREMERELRERERDEDAAYERRRRDHHHGRIWLGVGAGVGVANVETVCNPPGSSDDCSESGFLNTWSGNVTMSGSHGGAIRLRGVRATDKHDDARTPYETAALVGSRFGRSNWYGMVGYGRVHHPDDEAVRDESGGFAWEILFAPSTDGPVGLELGFMGNGGHHADYVAFNLGMRFGALR